jgi:hypothetical protein
MRSVRWGLVGWWIALTLGCSGDVKLAYSWACQSEATVSVDGALTPIRGYGKRYFQLPARWATLSDCEERVEATRCPSCRIEVTASCKVVDCREVPPNLW